jgi:hypothetical protein
MAKLASAFLLALNAVALSACGGGGEGEAPQAADTAQPAPISPAPANHAPTISGSAPTAINAQSAYTFTPSAADADGDTLAFSIQNKPSWATFNTATGRLSGTPSGADVGTYANIGISVSDGTANTALSAFSIAVTAISNGSATLSWTAPTENTDGSTLVDLSGYKISYGTDASSLTNTIVITNPSVTTYMVEDLSPATWYFAVSAVTSSGIESSLSNVANKAI